MSKVAYENLREHRNTHTKAFSWWAKDRQGIPLCRVCDDCEHLLPRLYQPWVLGVGEWEGEEPIDAE
jgi:hypothetical protein